jgi:TfoX/Sxy family transcriptional regulator of competence genes
MAYDQVLADRIRERLGVAPGVTEKKMFGGLAFLTGGAMTVGVYGDGMIARIDPATTDEAVAAQGVRRFEMGGRPMRGWVVVDGALLDDDVLDDWIARASRYVATLPPK